MSPAHRSTTRTILLVEHDPQVLNLVRTILEKADFTVLPATTMETALRIGLHFAGTIDLLISALTIPRLSACELGEMLERSRPGMTVMLMSGYPDCKATAEHHGWYFTSKPFLPSSLVDMARAATALDTPRQSLQVPAA